MSYQISESEMVYWLVMIVMVFVINVSWAYQADKESWRGIDVGKSFHLAGGIIAGTLVTMGMVAIALVVRAIVVWLSQNAL